MNGCTIPYTPIAVDFWKVRQSSRIRLFFCSHAHIDSSSGLSHTWSKPIYCSPITKRLLVQQFSIKPDIINELQLNVQNVINLTTNGEVKVKVLCIDANHYPGAVMFLFEGYFGRILYTGNFRFHVDMLNRSVKDFLVKPIDALYLDNSYCNPKCSFPSKQVCILQIIDIIKKNKTSKIFVVLNTIGKEDLLVFISSYLNCHIMVNPERMKILNALQKNGRFISNSSGAKCKIEVITLAKLDDIFMNGYDKQYLVIIPTASYMISSKFQNYENKPNIYFVPYSGHCNFSELTSFVERVHPRSIIPLVKSGCNDFINGSLIDRNNLECFQPFLDKSAKLQYNIPQSVMEIMNQGDKILKRRKKRSFEIMNNNPNSFSSSAFVVNKAHSQVVFPYIIVPKPLADRIKTERKLTLRPLTYPKSNYQKSILNKTHKLNSSKNKSKCLSSECLNEIDHLDVTRSRSAEFKTKFDGINMRRSCSNLIRSHRTRLCNPFQCQTICRHLHPMSEKLLCLTASSFWTDRNTRDDGIFYEVNKPWKFEKKEEDNKTDQAEDDKDLIVVNRPYDSMDAHADLHVKEEKKNFANDEFYSRNLVIDDDDAVIISDNEKQIHIENKYTKNKKINCVENCKKDEFRDKKSSFTNSKTTIHIAPKKQWRDKFNGSQT